MSSGHCPQQLVFDANSSFQLYEIDDEPGRKEFLDDLFTYMQKRGKQMWLQ